MDYKELRNKHRQELENFPMEFAFNSKQLEEGLKKLGIKKHEAVRLPVCGGFIRKRDSKEYLNLFFTRSREMAAAMQDDDFVIEAIEYELGNHEYCVTYNPNDALNTLGLSLKDNRTKRLFKIAEKKYINWQKQYG